MCGFGASVRPFQVISIATMFYPIGWLAPELPKPVSSLPSSERLATLPSAQAASLPHRPHGLVNGLSVAADLPRWAPGQHYSLAALPPSSVEPGQPIDLAVPTESTQALVLRQGSRGNAVWVLQARLQRLGYAPGPLDGSFGSQTEQAVRRFQRASYLTVDGVVGTMTWRYLVPGSPPAVSRPPLATQNLASTFPALAHTLSSYLTLHPMAVLPEGSPTQMLGMAVLGFGLAGLVMHLGFRPDAALRPRQSFVSAPLQPIHTPQPIYPVNPTSSPPAVSDLAPSPTPAPISSTPVSTHHAILPIADATHLPDFVYDLLQPYDRHQLEARLQGRLAQGVAAKGEVSAKAGQTSQSPPMLAALLQRVGIFPEHNHRTGSPYTYVLLDDVGGCFRLCGNELWLTHIIHHWFQPNVAYTAIIRRIDAAGQVLDKEFTVALSRQQLAWVA